MHFLYPIQYRFLSNVPMTIFKNFSSLLFSLLPLLHDRLGHDRSRSRVKQMGIHILTQPPRDLGQATYYSEPQFSCLQNGDSSVSPAWRESPFPVSAFAFYIHHLSPRPPPPRTEVLRVYIVDSVFFFFFRFFFKVPSELSLVHVLRITNDYGPLVPKCIPDGQCSHSSIGSGAAGGSYCNPHDGVWTRKVEVFQCKGKKGRGYSNPNWIAHQRPPNES